MQTSNFVCPESSAISGTVFLSTPSFRRMQTERQSNGNETYLLSTVYLLWQVPVTENKFCPRGILTPKAEARKTVSGDSKGRDLSHVNPWMAAVKMALSSGPEGVPKWRWWNNSEERQGAALLGSNRLSVVMEHLPLLLKVWSSDQQNQHDLGICCTCRILDPTPDLLSQNLYFNKTPDDVYAC